MLEIRFCPPAPRLKQFIRFYVQRQVKITGPVVLHPVPARASPMIEFEFGDPVCVVYTDHPAPVTSPTAIIVGPQTYRRVEMHLHGDMESFVIMFQPDGLHRLFSVPMHELTDHDYDAHSVLGAFTTSLRQRLGECTSFAERVCLIDSLLLGRSMQAAMPDGISAAAQRLLFGGGSQITFREFADASNLSLRQFERRFTSQVGMRPKLFARIARFEAALDHKARSAATSWTDVAHQFGYYDQMHLVHDFAEFTGATPTHTLHQLETVFVEQIRAMRANAKPAARPDSRLIL